MPFLLFTNEIIPSIIDNNAKGIDMYIKLHIIAIIPNTIEAIPSPFFLSYTNLPKYNKILTQKYHYAIHIYYFIILLFYYF